MLLVCVCYEICIYERNYVWKWKGQVVLKRKIASAKLYILHLLFSITTQGACQFVHAAGWGPCGMVIFLGACVHEAVAKNRDCRPMTNILFLCGPLTRLPGTIPCRARIRDRLCVIRDQSVAFSGVFRVFFTPSPAVQVTCVNKLNVWKCFRNIIVWCVIGIALWSKNIWRPKSRPAWVTVIKSHALCFFQPETRITVWCYLKGNVFFGHSDGNNRNIMLWSVFFWWFRTFP